MASLTPTESRTHFAELGPMLRCPECAGKLRPDQFGFFCEPCQKSYPVTDGVLRFVSSDQYATSFGFEWNRHALTQLDHEGSRISEDDFPRKTGFTPEEIRGKWILDVGCGMGRFADVASRWGAKVVGIDLSRASDMAAKNLGARNNFWICQASVFKLPFAPESFDFIYSIGVLHHTPNCEQAFKALPPLLKPDGVIAIWLYSAYNKWYRMSDVYRRVTTKLPHRVLHGMCQAVAPLYYVHAGLRRIPLIGHFSSGVLNYILPLPLHAQWDWRVLDTFDWYSPQYQSKHTYEEVFRWFEACGLRDLRVLYEPVAVQGRKPSVSATPHDIVETVETGSRQAR